MAALIGNCKKVLGHEPLGVNTKSKNMITHKTYKLTSDTNIFQIYLAVFSKKSELSVLAFHKLYIDVNCTLTQVRQFLQKRIHQNNAKR